LAPRSPADNRGVSPSQDPALPPMASGFKYDTRPLDGNEKSLVKVEWVKETLNEEGVAQYFAQEIVQPWKADAILALLAPDANGIVKYRFEFGDGKPSSAAPSAGTSASSSSNRSIPPGNRNSSGRASARSHP
jgi:hypothetical protein